LRSAADVIGGQQPHRTLAAPTIMVDPAFAGIHRIG
jgi:hypothetical protein